MVEPLSMEEFNRLFTKKKRISTHGTPAQVEAKLEIGLPEVTPTGKIVTPALPALDEGQLLATAVSNPTAPKAYQGLQTGPQLSVQYEDNQTTQVEASNPLLRNLSPFMLRIEPPLAYSENGGFQNRKINSVATDFNVMSSPGLIGYETSRRALAQSGMFGLTTAVGSVEEFVVQNGSGNQKNRTPTGQKADRKGNTEGNLGQPAIADIMAAADMAWQLSNQLSVPPLVLLINPTSLSIAHTKVQAFQDRSRYGYIFQTWGEEQPRLSIAARCGAFISGSRGLQIASRRDSVAWQNLMNAFHFFQNNGYIYDTVGQSNANTMVGAISIHYDGWIYYGHIESFTYTLDDVHTHGGVDFSIEFIASSIVDTAQTTFVVGPMQSPVPSLSDPRYSGMTNPPQPSKDAGLNSLISNADANIDAFYRRAGQGTTKAVKSASSSKPGKGGFHLPEITYPKVTYLADPKFVSPFKR